MAKTNIAQQRMPRKEVFVQSLKNEFPYDEVRDHLPSGYGLGQLQIFSDGQWLRLSYAEESLVLGRATHFAGSQIGSGTLDAAIAGAKKVVARNTGTVKFERNAFAGGSITITSGDYAGLSLYVGGNDEATPNATTSTNYDVEFYLIPPLAFPLAADITYVAVGNPYDCQMQNLVGADGTSITTNIPRFYTGVPFVPVDVEDYNSTYGRCGWGNPD
jgi:hypothetical protein